MKKSEIQNAFQKIKLDQQSKKRIYAKIKQSKTERVAKSKQAKLFPILIGVCLLVSGIVIAIPYLNDGEQTADLLMEDRDENDWSEISDGDQDITVEMLDKLANEFQLDNRYYSLLHEDTRAIYKLPKKIHERDIGEQIARISVTVDDRLSDKEVYRYLPANSEAVVAVKINETYELFEFVNFESYLNNQDEDVDAYFSVFGIKSAADIDRIMFLSDSNQIISELNNKADMKQFYNYYSKLKNASDAYFAQLNIGQGKELTYDEDSAEGQSTPAYEGSGQAALENPVKIRIYQESTVFYETVYYPNIRFISRHQVTDEFNRFLQEKIQ